MRAQLDGEQTARGIYAWWLAISDALPGVPTTPHPSESVGLLYVGIGPGSARSLNRTLRDRFRDHTTKNTGASTLRLVLAAFLFESQGWQPYWRDRPLLRKGDNIALSAWQATNLLVQWTRFADPWEIEADVVDVMRPPLNRDHNERHEFYSKVGAARAHFRAVARANGSTPP
jgi:GIY-YIG catalytic domain-containing protein